MTPTKIDAVRAPIHHAGTGDGYARLGRLQAEFSEILGVSKVFVRNQGAEHFITGRSDDTLGRPRESRGSGEPGYDWVDRGDGVFYGSRRDHD